MGGNGIFFVALHFCGLFKLFFYYGLLREAVVISSCVPISHGIFICLNELTGIAGIILFVRYFSLSFSI